MSTSARNWAFQAFIAILLVHAPHARAGLTRGAAVACVKQYYGIIDMAQQEYDTYVPGAAEDNAGQFVNDAALRMGIAYKIKVLTCEDSPNANAFYSTSEDNLPPDFTNENYIIYNKSWVTDRLGTEELLFVLGHELAHITNNHNTTRQNLDPVKKELEADYSGGCYVGRMKGSKSAMEEFLKRERAIPSPNYGSVEESLAEARSGFANCGEIPNPNPLPGIDVVYFAKDSDSGKVEAALERNHIPFTPREGEYGEVSDTIVCTADVPVDDIKLLALLLYDAGIKLKSIQRHSNAELSSRLQIESGWSADRANDYIPLTRDRIESLTECPDFEAQPTAANIRFKNNCSQGEPDLFVRFFDAEARKWETAEFGELEYGNVLVLANEDGEEYRTDRPFYYYAELPDQAGSWPSASAADRQIQLSDGRTVGFKKVRHTGIRALSCSKLEN